MATQWQINGDYLESCTCRGACPCIYTGAPTEGDCTALVGWHIASGQYGNLGLDGLNVAIVLYSPAAMHEGNWTVVLYLDQCADQAQQEALGTIFGGQAGGHPELLASFIGEVKGVEQLPLEYVSEQGRRHLKVGTQAGADIAAVPGQEGAEITIRNHPFAVAPGESLVLAESRALNHQSHGINLDHSGRTAFYSPFAYAGP